MIRPATLSDAGLILEIAKIHAREMYPLMNFDEKKVRKLIASAISSAKHFCWVAVKDGHPAGVLAGMTVNNAWAERQSCHIMLWSARPRCGAPLLLEFKSWLRERRAIRVAGFMPDTNNMDARVWTLVERAGFQRHGGAYLLYN